MRNYIFKIIICFWLGILFAKDVNSQKISEMLKDADYLYKNKYYQNAMDMYSNILIIEPNSEDAYLGRANTGLSMGKTDNILNDLHKALKINDKNHRTYFYLAKYNYFIDNKNEAIKYYKKAIQLKSDTAIYYLGAAECYKAENKIDSAYFFYEEALKVQFDYVDAFYYKANFEYELGFYEQALENATSGLKINPYHLELLILKAYLGMALEKFDLALETCNLILYQFPLNTAALQIRSQAYFVKNELDKAISDAKYCYFQDNKNIQNIIILAWAYYYIKDYQNSIKYATIGQEIIPEHPDFFSIIGLSYLFLEDYTNAYKTFDLATKNIKTEIVFYEYKTQTKIILNTQEDIFKADIFNEDKTFKYLSQDNMKEMNKLCKNKDSKYYYSTLLTKFETDNNELSADEYFMLYYGSSLQKNYNPYQITELKMALFSYYTLKQTAEIIRIATDLINQNIIFIDLYLYLANAYLDIKDYKLYEKYISIYYGLIIAISYSGTGNTATSPLIVTSVADQYSWLAYKGYKTIKPKILKNKKHTYDVFLTEDFNKQQQQIFFNIDKFYSHKNKK